MRFGLLERNSVAQLRGDLAGCRAHEQNQARPRAERRGERREIAALVLAAQNHQQVPRKSVDGLERGIDVRRFRIVVEGDAGNLRDEFQPVLDAGKTAHRFPNRIRRDAREHGDAGGGENVFDVVFATQRNIGPVQEAHAVVRRAKNDPAALEARTLVDRLAPAEPETARPFRRQASGGGIVGVHHGRIFGALILENSLFRPGVGFERGVTVEVIGRQVEQRGNVGTEMIGDGLELKAGNLGHGDRVVPGLIHQRNERRAHVSADQHAAAGFAQDVAREQRGGGLAVRAGDRDQLAAQEARCQLNLAPDRNAAGARRGERLDFERNAGAGHDQVRVEERRGSMPAQLEADAGRAQFASGTGDGFFRPVLARGDASAAGAAEKRRRQPGSFQADHEHAFVFQIHSAFTSTSKSSG